MRGRIEEADENLNVSRAKLVQYEKLTELSAESLLDDSDDLKKAAKQVIQGINKSIEQTKGDIDYCERKKTETDRLEITISKMKKELERLDKIKANIQ